MRSSHASHWTTHIYPRTIMDKARDAVEIPRKFIKEGNTVSSNAPAPNQMDDVFESSESAALTLPLSHC